MLIPAIFDLTVHRLHDAELGRHEHGVSVATSIVLVLIYLAGLLFTLRTHAQVFTRRPHAPSADPTRGVDLPPSPASASEWSTGRSVTVLLLASMAIAVVAELLVGSAERMAHAMGWNQVFVGVILLAVIGNAAEHSTAVMLAMRDDMDTAIAIAQQSSLQIALFATPLLVFISAALVASGVGEAKHYLNLVFTPLEVVAVFLSVITVVVLGRNGETNWFEGVLLLGVYAILAVAFFYLPAQPAGAAPGH
jgi:Ca2+:H+ antiporter